MYAIHRTKGLVLASFVSGEADRRYIILTEAFGRIEARARSVRLERSKLRYGLSPHTLGTYALVRGKSGWHIVGSHDEENFFLQTLHASHKRKALEHITHLLVRLVVEEGKHEDLFTTAVIGITALVTEKKEEVVQAVELITVLRSMYLLGYISQEGDSSMLVPFLSDTTFTPALAEQAQKNRAAIIRAINNAIAASHL